MGSAKRRNSICVRSAFKKKGLRRRGDPDTRWRLQPARLVVFLLSKVYLEIKGSFRNFRMKGIGRHRSEGVKTLHF